VGLRLTHGSIEFQPALAALMLTPEFFLPIRQLALRYHSGAAGATAAEAIFAVLDAPLPQRRGTQPRLKWRSATAPQLRFAAVSFSYESGRPALSDVSFTMPAGTTTALVGPSGAGKTTIVNLLLGFIEPGAGTITADGVTITSLDLAEWRRGIAWVPQRPHLFAATVADNIRLARPHATWQEIATAARAAGAHDFIQDLPQGYDTPLGEEGVGLSGGEKQRLAIARAFLKEAPLLILDEPTSHLDAGDEAIVAQALKRLGEGRTVLLVAHRVELAKAADQVLVLEDGRIVDRGCRDEAAALRGVDAPFRSQVA
jgi:ATP-binding cassette subfamily C protein CydD